MVRQRFLSLADYFSISLLLRTFFSPFRQISAERVDGSLATQLHAFFDQLISRVIGALVRLILILVGMAALGVYGLGALLWLLLWAVIPLVPIGSIVLFVIGWLPWIR